MHQRLSISKHNSIFSIINPRKDNISFIRDKDKREAVKSKFNNSGIKINNYLRTSRNSSQKNENFQINQNDISNVNISRIVNKSTENDIDMYDKFKLRYNKNRNKVSSKELIRKLDMLSKKGSEIHKSSLYKIQGEKIIIDNENPKDNIFNPMVEEIYTNKSTKMNEFKKVK